ncbi:3-hydroxyacyl-CoA dehydrogenase family protein [Stackebrandtia soli]|uniref:3-hydroxyacyl-CoA dehydrogenase family protein n=1 Tax=Stackebrandtia soli TaxID=1892856 RepID=UPI0039EBFF09
MDRFVVVGAGTMGAGIGYVAARAGYDVTIVEIDSGRGSAALERVGSWADSAVERGRLDAETALAIRDRLSTVTELTAVDTGADVIVEAVPERPELKHTVLAAAEEREPKLLASNTSSISIATLAEPLARPDRFLGLHFFNPVYAMALLEVVTGPQTAPEVVADALALARRLDKEPIVVADAPGFATSRLGVTLGLEAIRMLESGVASAADIDTAMVLGYRHPIGPLELTDLVGLDVRLDIARTLQSAYGDRFEPPSLLVRLVEEGRLGKKTGHGIYRWVDGKRVAE